MIQRIQPVGETSANGVASGALPSPSTFNPTMRPQRPKPMPQPVAPAQMPAAAGGFGVTKALQAGQTMGQANPLPSPASVAPPPKPNANPLMAAGGWMDTDTRTSGPTGAGAPPLPAAAPPLTNPGGTVATTPIDPTNDLRSSAVLPTSSPALDEARAGMVGAAKGVAGYDRAADVASNRADLSQFFGPTDVHAGSAVGTAPSARLASYNTLLDDSAGKLAGVDRVKLAQDMLAQFDDQQLPEHELALRKITEKFAAKGGARSGMLRTDYGKEDLTRMRDRDAMKKSLISAAIEGSIQDQFNKTNALSGLQSGTAAQDAGVRGEQRTDRGYATDVATGNVERGLSAKLAASAGANAAADSNRVGKTTGLAAMSDLFNTLYGEGAAGRTEVRGERAYEGGQEDQSYRRAMSELDTEEQRKTADLNRQLALLGAGEAGNPSGTLATLANGTPGLDPALIAALGSSLGQQANSGSSELDAILAALRASGTPTTAKTSARTPAAPVPVAAGNDPAYEY